MPAGYAYDFVNADIVQHELTVDHGTLKTKSGMGYRVLVIDPQVRRLTVPTLRKLRGRIGILSTPGCGATVVIKLPLTMAVIEGLVVGVGAHRYIVPLFTVRAMFRPARGKVENMRHQITPC